MMMQPNTHSRNNNRNNKQNVILLDHNRMNSEKAMELVQLQTGMTPINVLTATFLDPRRYHKFLHIWLYLIMIFGAQIVQYSWLVSLGNKWKARLSDWVQKVKNLDTPFSRKYKWFAFKEDYLPESTQLFLSSFAKSMESSNSTMCRMAPIVTMGASYVDPGVPNVVFDDDDDVVDDNTITSKQLDSTTTYNKNDIAAYLQSSTEKVILNSKELDSNYQKWEAKHIPVWKSRFILAPKHVPSNEEVEREISDGDITASYDDPLPTDDEFKAYLFEDFLNDLEPEIYRRYMRPQERTRYILNDIEHDREEIIKKAIQRARKGAIG